MQSQSAQEVVGDMMRLKAGYITFYFPVMLIMILHALYGLFAEGWAWFGVLVSVATHMGVFGWLYRPEIARTSTHLTSFTSVSLLGSAIAWAGYLTDDSLTVFPIIYTSVGLLHWLGYVYWYSRFYRTDSEQLQVGKILPTFSLQDVNGREVGSDSLTGTYALFMFYRGNWCPLCMSQVREIASLYQQLEKRGVEIVLISPQSHEFTQELAAKYELPFHFWVDGGAKVARQLGIVHLGGTPVGMSGYDADTVLPTVVITNKQREILFVDQTDNYRLRPEPQTFLRVLDGYTDMGMTSAAA